VLALVADDDEGLAARQGRGRGERDRPEFRAGDPVDAGTHVRREQLAELDEHVGLGLEAVLVEVVVALAAAAQRELAAQQGDLDEARGERLPGPAARPSRDGRSPPLARSAARVMSAIGRSTSVAERYANACVRNRKSSGPHADEVSLETTSG